MTHLLNSRGFTLVEVFAAILIFLLGLLPFLKLQISTIDSNYAANQLTEATNLAESKMEQLLGMNYEGLINATISSQTTDGFTVNWSRAQDSPLSNTTTVTVTVSWTDKENRAHNVSVSSVKGN